MNDVAKQKRKEYMREYREKRREELKAYKREWNRNNPDRVKQHQETYWTKQAMNNEAEEHEAVKG